MSGHDRDVFHVFFSTIHYYYSPLLLCPTVYPQKVSLLFLYGGRRVDKDKVLNVMRFDCWAMRYKIELPILEQLVSIKNRLNALKRDRSSYLKTQDIIPLKEETEEQIEKLSSFRGGDLLPKGVEPTRTDQVLDEVCQLLSLSFLSLGKTRESK